VTPRLRALIKGGEDFAAMLATKGELKGPLVRTAMKGFGTYAKALLSGDVADEWDRAERVRKCSTCINITSRDDVATDEKPYYCGRPFVEAGEDGCGCLVALSVKGRLIAAGKTEVGSQTCPRDLW
jgi:hypothetical protein